MSSRSGVALTLLLAAACGDNRAPASKQLQAALNDEALGVEVSTTAESTLEVDEQTGAYGQRGEGLRLMPGSGAVVAPDLTLRPVAGPDDFPSWGPGRPSRDAVIYLSRDGRSAVAHRLDGRKAKEDIVLTRSLGDTLTFAWELSTKLPLRLLGDGSVRVGEQYLIPAPVVKTRGGLAPGVARFRLDGARLELVAKGLDALAYPLTIDPTLIVTSTSDFTIGGNLEGGIDVGTNRIVRGRGGRTLGAFTTLSTGLPVGRARFATAIYNNFLYVTGGDTSSSTSQNDVLYAQINADGSLGNFTTATSTFSGTRRNHTTVAYNGYLYVICGEDSSGTPRFNIQAAPINTNGSLGAFTTVTNFLTIENRYSHASVAYNGYVYIIGGIGLSGLAAEVRVARINPDGTLGTFNFTASLSAPRHSHSAVAWQNRLYVIGGTISSGASATIESAPINADGTLGAFTTAAATLPSGRSGLSAVAYHGHLYSTGGFSGGNFSFNDVQVAQLRSDGDAFSSTTSFSGGRRFHAALAHNGHLYVVGGLDATSSTYLSDVQRAPISLLDTSGSFTQNGQVMTSTRSQAPSFVNNNILYVVGGRSAGLTNTVLMATINNDGSTGPFSTAAQTFPGSRQRHTALAYDDFLFVVGGEDGLGVLYSDVYKSALAGGGAPGGFINTTALPAGRTGHASVAYNGFFYVIGGRTASGTVSDVLYAPIANDGTLGGWQSGTSFGGAGREDLAAVVYAGSLYVIGGQNGLSTNACQVSALSPTGSNGAWTSCTSLPLNQFDVAAVAFNDHLYVTGGDGPAGNSNEVQVAPIYVDGGLGAWALNPIFSGARSAHASVVHDDRLYVIGGNSSAVLRDDIWYTTVKTSGGVNAFAATTSVPTARYRHASAVYNGHVYVAGGNGSALLSDVQFAPVTASGLGAFTGTTAFSPARENLGLAAYNGYLYLSGGAGPLERNDVLYAPINTDGTLGAWTATSAFTTARYAHGSVAHRGYLYIAGGTGPGNVLQNDVQFAAINANGTLGAFTATSSFAVARTDMAVVAYNGYLYVIGGVLASGGRPDVQVAPIAADGTLGAFVPTATLPARRSQHAAVAYEGYLYVAGGLTNGWQDDVLVAPIRSDGRLGNWVGSSRFATASIKPTVVAADGKLLVIGGADSSNIRQNLVRVASLRTATAAGTYSRVFDLTSRGTAASFTVNGSPTLGTVRLSYVTAPESGTFGFPTNVGPIALGSPVTLNRPDVRWVMATLALDDTLSAASNIDAPNARDVTDISLTYNLNPVLSPQSPTTAPRGGIGFSCVSGSGGWLYAVTGNNSGATIDAAGNYVAGPTGSVFDTVTCTDSMGLTDTANVTVLPGITITPASSSVAPRASVDFDASGGSTMGYTWSMMASPSGGTIVPATGVYTAGTTPNVTDVVRVTDSLGNTATENVTVGPAVAISPLAVTLPPRGSQAFSADGGNGIFSFSMVSNPSGGMVGMGTGAYTAGSVGLTTDAVRVSDSVGNIATATVTVTAGVSILPATLTVVPRGSQAFTAIGGSGTGFTWALTASPSGGSIVMATGAYVAGSTGSVNDVVRATDSLGNVQTATVMVGPGVTISPMGASTAPLGSIPFSASGGSGTGYVWALTVNNSGGTLNTGSGAYTAGPTMAMDTVQVTDSLGNTSTVTVTVTNALAISPTMASVAPRGTVAFSTTGGSGMGNMWVLETNASGGTINPTTGMYQAGNTGAVFDRVKVTDSLGATAAVDVRITAAVSVMPAAPTVSPRGAISFTAIGGSNSGYTWSVSTNASGGTINASSGAYTAGGTGSVSDVVTVTDSLGGTATVTIAVTPGVSISPAMPSVPPRGALNFTASGGSGSGFTWSLVSRSGGVIDGFTGAYTAGTTGNVVDTIQVRDSLNNPASIDVTVTSGLTIVPVDPRVPPRGTLALSVSGGVGPFTWVQLPPNNSGGSIDPGTGVFTAGPTPSVTDTVKVIDSLGNSNTSAVSITAGVTVDPAQKTVGPGGAVQLTASGGSNLGFTWELSTDGSGATVSAEGLYTAGNTPATTDVVRATDSLGNSGTATLSVIAGANTTEVPYSQRPPISGFPCGCSSSPLAGMAGLALLLLRRRRRLTSWLVLGLLFALPAFAAAAKKAKPAAPAAAPAPAPPPPVAAPEPAPQPAPPPPAPRHEKLSVAVIDVEVTVPGEKLDATAFTEMLTSSVDGTGMFRVVTSKDIQMMLGIERQKALLGCSEDTSCMAEIANALGTDMVMVATVGRVGSTYLVSVKLIDGRSSRTVARASAEANDTNVLLKAIWSASQETLDRYGAGLEPVAAAKWASRPKQSAPAQLVATENSVPQFFGVSLGVVGGVQLFSAPGNRGSIGAEVDVTYRRQRLDVSAGLVIGPNIGARVAISFALIASRFRFGLGVRGTGYPGAGLWGGGVIAQAEFGILSWLGVYANGAFEAYPVSRASPLLVLLGTVGPAAHF